MEALLVIALVACYLWLLVRADRSQARKDAERNAKAEAAAIERAKARENAAKAIDHTTHERKRGRPRKVAVPSEPEPVKSIAPSAPVAEEKPVPAPGPDAYPVRFTPIGNNAFAGEIVAFTGKLSGMTRQEAIAAVRRNGGQAFDSMPSGATILVVGDKPGEDKLGKAENWGVKKISDDDFWALVNQPLTLELNQAASYIAGLLNDHNTCKEA